MYLFFSPSFCIHFMQIIKSHYVAERYFIPQLTVSAAASFPRPNQSLGFWGLRFSRQHECLFTVPEAA